MHLNKINYLNLDSTSSIKFFKNSLPSKIKTVTYSILITRYNFSTKVVF